MTPSYSAVPFWFAVAPTVSTKFVMSGRTLRFSFVTRIAVGSVTFDELVENAVSITSRMPRKNCAGLRPAPNRMISPYVTN